MGAEETKREKLYEVIEANQLMVVRENGLQIQQQAGRQARIAADLADQKEAG